MVTNKDNCLMIDVDSIKKAIENDGGKVIDILSTENTLEIMGTNMVLKSINKVKYDKKIVDDFFIQIFIPKKFRLY